jgi:transposase
VSEAKDQHGREIAREDDPRILERRWIESSEHILVVMEATSTYWIMLVLATHLHEAGYAVSVVNPAQAYHFAKAQLKRAKTDALDAQTLAHLAPTLKPHCWTPPPAIYHQLQQRLALLDSLLNVQGQLRNQLHALQHNRVVIPHFVQDDMGTLFSCPDIILLVQHSK